MRSNELKNVIVEFVVADRQPNRTQSLMIQKKEIQITTFSDEYFSSIPFYNPAQTRSKSKGLIVLLETIRKLKLKTQINQASGIYAHCLAGPFNRKIFDHANQMSYDEKLAYITKNLPPKQYFIQHPAMKVAQIPIEFKLHGPWITFGSDHGFQQSWEQAMRDINDKVVPSALICTLFSLDDAIELQGFADHSNNLIEACAVFYVDGGSDDYDRPAFKFGKYGSLTGFLEKHDGRK